MTEDAILARPKPGSKFISPQGTRAVKDGVRPHVRSNVPDAAPKPPWLHVKLPGGAAYQDVHDIVKSHKLNTVCAESKCPNRAECWGRGTATLMRMGAVCTRACQVCEFSTGQPHGWLDSLATEKEAGASELLRHKY